MLSPLMFSQRIAANGGFAKRQNFLLLFFRPPCTIRGNGQAWLRIVTILMQVYILALVLSGVKRYANFWGKGFAFFASP